MLNVYEIRKDFPILQRKINGKTLVYLDNAATTQKPRSVSLALQDFYNFYNSNIHRGIHTLSEEATFAYEDVRKRVADFIGAEQASIVFTRNATESINLVAYAWGRKYLREGDEVILSIMEHHSNIVPWLLLKRDRGINLKFLSMNEDGTLSLSLLEEMISEKTKLVSITQMSNFLGTINPVKEIAKIAHGKNAVLLVDGAQSVPHMEINVEDMDCDFLAFSAHKMLGPTGIGVLYGKSHILEEMEPFLGGGDMISRVSLNDAEWNKIPWKFEAGTPDVGGVIAFGEALIYLRNIGMENIMEHDKNITSYALKKLKEIRDITIYGPQDANVRGSVISFNLKGIHPHDIGTLLDEEGVAIRAGHHCCQPLMEHLGVSGTARASFYFYNTIEEVDRLINSVKHVIEVFNGEFVHALFIQRFNFRAF